MPPRIWYLNINGENLGPYTLGEMKVFRREGRIMPDTPVWREGFSAWIPAEESSEISIEGALNPCRNHRSVESTDICVDCRGSFCEECVVYDRGVSRCRDCWILRYGSENVSILKAFLFIFEEPGFFPKLILGGLLSIFSVFLLPMVIMMGFAFNTARNVIRGAKLPMPDWDLAALFMDGLKPLLVFLVFVIPANLIFFAAVVVRSVFWLINNWNTLASSFSPPGGSPMPGTAPFVSGTFHESGIVIWIFRLLMIFGLIILSLFPASFAELARSDSLVLALDPRTWYRLIIRNFDQFIRILIGETIITLAAFCAVYGFNFFLMGFGAVIVGPVVGFFWMLILAHLSGQIIRVERFRRPDFETTA